jgi:hypothetical protein
MVCQNTLANNTVGYEVHNLWRRSEATACVLEVVRNVEFGIEVRGYSRHASCTRKDCHCKVLATFVYATSISDIVWYLRAMFLKLQTSMLHKLEQLVRGVVSVESIEGDTREPPAALTSTGKTPHSCYAVTLRWGNSKHRGCHKCLSQRIISMLSTGNLLYVSTPAFHLFPKKPRHLQHPLANTHRNKVIILPFYSSTCSKRRTVSCLGLIVSMFNNVAFLAHRVRKDQLTVLVGSMWVFTCILTPAMEEEN